MYDRKTVRRRRAVLGLLVAGALILLTAYFGESSSGGLHSAQRGVFSIVTPIQDGASRALKPFRDLVNWVGDTIDAKGEVEDLRKERDAYRLQRADYNAMVNENRRLTKLLGLNQALGIAQYGPVTGRVIASAQGVWSQQVTLNVGTSDGVQADMPVIDSSGLVGKVKDAGSTGSIVTLLTSGDMEVGVTVQRPTRDGDVVRGTAKAAVGNPNDIVMTGTNNKNRVAIGDIVVTSGTVMNSSEYTSLYPRGIPVGVVWDVDDPGTDQQKIHLRPAAQVRDLNEAQVLTKVNR